MSLAALAALALVPLASASAASDGPVALEFHRARVLREIRQQGGEDRPRLDVAVTPRPEGGLTAEQGCAILVQSDQPGPILGAAACPAVRP